jgi:hypothetical protein
MELYMIISEDKPRGNGANKPMAKVIPTNNCILLSWRRCEPNFTVERSDTAFADLEYALAVVQGGLPRGNSSPFHRAPQVAQILHRANAYLWRPGHIRYITMIYIQVAALC